MRKIILLLILAQGILHGQGFIPPGFFGMNYWMPLYYINSLPSTLNGHIENSTIQKKVSDAYPIVYRIGGDGYDTHGTAIGTTSLTNDYIRAMEVILASNPKAKFIIQIPFKSGIPPDSAAILVSRINNAYPMQHQIYAIGN